ncbi:transcriptional regulator [Sulfitobacter undariae]|uniref:Transcriptional regulator n=1 Tax=Sulfitobacter undariae TaxID=1563671 RepID=A0A7W6E7P1_9RHOB|nr:hypothetical protein [Sulfitobacter undariae]MBB3992759.1 transcriptional regulator [Sulfitobacter undariae]
MNNHSEVLYVLSIALIEIRATGNLEKAHILADVVHNVPTMISAGSSADEIAEKVMLNAKRHGADDYFSKLFEKAKKQ